MAFTWAAAVANALADAIAAYFVDGVGKWYDSVPAEICSFTFTGDGFGAASGGVVTNTTMTVGTNSTGSSKTIASLRCFETDGTTEICRSAVSVIGGGEAVELTSLTLADDETVQLTEFEITVGPVTA